MASRFSAKQVGGNPSDKIGMEGRSGDFLEKEVVIDSVECFRDVDGEGRRPFARYLFLEPSVLDREKRSSGGMHWLKSVLGLRTGEGSCEVGENEALEHLDNWR